MLSLAEFIAAHHDTILQTWAGDAQRIAAARGLSRPELLNILPRYLTSLGQAGDENQARRHQLLESHLSARLREGFRLDEILGELTLLGRSIIEVRGQTPPGDQPDGAELRILFEELNAASRLVVEAFMPHFQEDAQLDKRYARRLQALASEALRSDSDVGPLRTRLKDVLEIVMEAMGAQTAALLLYDAERQSLLMAASAGRAEEPLEHYATSIGAASFAATVAAREEETTAIRDVATTSLEVSPALRQSGIHAVLGVRLPTRHMLLGVLYIGLDTERTFSAREGRRLESLGEQLALHLDNARLYGALRETIEDLRVERALREEFIALIAHDLRNPLTVARINTDRMLREALPPETARTLLTRVLRNIDRTDRMTRDLLDALRIRAGQGLPLVLAPCDLAAVAAEALDELTAIHGARFELRGDAQVPGVWSAEDLRRAIVNLAANAVKYGAADAPVVVTVRRREGGAEVTVHNDGPAIAPEDQATLFESFAQLRAPTKDRTSGWGLGLTLVRACAEAHGGVVAVASAPGAGTTFTITLPADARPHHAGG